MTTTLHSSKASSLSLGDAKDMQPQRNAQMNIEEKKEDVPHQQTTTEKLTAGVLEARKSLIKVLMEHRFKQRFSSTALRLDSSTNSRASITRSSENADGSMLEGGQPSRSRYRHHSRTDSGLVVAASNSFTSCSSDQKQQQPNPVMEDGPGITVEEREYLEQLIMEGDVATMEAARDRLQDPTLFPTNNMDPPNELEEMAAAAASLSISTGADESQSKDGNFVREPPKRRDSKVQQKLFQIHQEKKVQPSRVLEYLKRNSILQSEELKVNESSDRKVSSTSSPPHMTQAKIDRESLTVEPSSREISETQQMNLGTDGSQNSVDGASREALPKEAVSPDGEAGEDGDGVTLERSFTDVDPFKDISSWIDGGQGVEVNDSGIPIIGRSSSSSSSRSVNNSNTQTGTESDHPTNRPFRILGTSADDVSCHPHVLSPPLMESLLAFAPEGLTNCNYWLKYSLVRDGASMWTMMRKVRASNATVLAIETVDGHVFGAFTNHSWRFSVGWYGGQQAFLWKMRRSRLETTKSIFEQAVQESEVQVFPVRPGNVAVQYCSKECLMLGRGEIKGHKPEKYGGKHYGHGIYLDSSLLRGTTSSSETFGNPCLVDDAERGTRFDVSNIEIWTLTTHDNVNEAQQSELSTMFLEGGRTGDNLNLLGILVGGPI